jgi:hypothetical protein
MSAEIDRRGLRMPELQTNTAVYTDPKHGCRQRLNAKKLPSRYVLPSARFRCAERNTVYHASAHIPCSSCSSLPDAHALEQPLPVRQAVFKYEREVANAQNAGSQDWERLDPPPTRHPGLAPASGHACDTAGPKQSHHAMPSDRYGMHHSHSGIAVSTRSLEEHTRVSRAAWS